MQHFLETYGGQSILGYGKPFRGFVETYEAPLKGASTEGMIEASGRRLWIYTSTVQDFVEISSTPEATLWLVETLNSVYVVSRRTM
jgi:hypothetical protein